MDFYRNRKNKSISKQYDELDNKAKELTNEDYAESFNNDESIPTECNSDNPIENQSEEIKEADEVLEQSEEIKEADEILELKKSSKLSNLANNRSTEESPWDKCSFENLCLLEPFCHNPYQYGDIMEDGRVFVWKGKFVDKKTFFKSYSKSKQWLAKKRRLGLSITDICKRTGLSKPAVNNALYYPYIKNTEMLVEQFERKYATIE